MNGEAHHLKVYNLPAHAEVKINGFKDPSYNLAEGAVLLFSRLEDMEAVCKVEGTKNEISIPADTAIVEMGNGEYEVEELNKEEDRSY